MQTLFMSPVMAPPVGLTKSYSLIESYDLVDYNQDLKPNLLVFSFLICTVVNIYFQKFTVRYLRIMIFYHVLLLWYIPFGS